MPVGTIIDYAGTSAPKGYLVCDGSLISRATYAKLFTTIGELYGAGDGSTTFKLPNLIDRVKQGASTAGTYKEAGLPNITGFIIPHGGNDVGTGYTVINGIGGAFYGTNQQIYYAQQYQGGSSPSWGTANFDASRSSSIYKDNVTTVQMASLCVLVCIKY